MTKGTLVSEEWLSELESLAELITPGPWCWDTYNTVFHGIGAQSKQICSIPDHPQDAFYTPEQMEERSKWYAESAANARVIEMLPSLIAIARESQLHVDLLQRFINYHDAVARSESAQEVQECVCLVCGDARAALATYKEAAAK